MPLAIRARFDVGAMYLASVVAVFAVVSLYKVVSTAVKK